MRIKTLFTALALLATAAAAAAQIPKPTRAPQAPSYMPDLVVTKSELLSYDTGKFKVTVRNKGKGGAQAAVIRLLVRGYDGKTYAAAVKAQPALAPQEEQSVTLEVNKMLGSMDYEVFTDSAKQIAETNELNNVYKGYVGKP